MTAWQIKARPLSDNQVKAALEHIAASSERPLRDELILWLKTSASLRAHEIAGLKLSDLWDQEGRLKDAIEIPRPLAKYSPARTIQVTARVREALLRFRSTYPDAKTIGETFGSGPTPIIQKHIDELCSAIGYVETSSRYRPHFAPLDHLEAPKQAPAPSGPEHEVSKRHRQPRFRPSDITRAVDAVKRAGLEITATEVGRDGSIRLSHAPTAASSQSAYDTWKERRDARSI
ncbi:site-specific integrase [Parafrankia sp. BMG5.11]|uniref:site-specific integrase n=1 Tax=Parafrankia sp. BMG5.11 TaxID=222540 RepID=UPI00103AFE45|nr:site-specific integrase [Parafrankia sp. BMG5.11]TCJ39096.1 site-specific integrase [Parafrankia sp. BMG5.11]